MILNTIAPMAMTDVKRGKAFCEGEESELRQGETREGAVWGKGWL